MKKALSVKKSAGLIKRRGSDKEKKEIEISSVAPIFKVGDVPKEMETKSISPGERNSDQMTHDEAPEPPKQIKP